MNSLLHSLCIKVQASTIMFICLVKSYILLTHFAHNFCRFAQNTAAKCNVEIFAQSRLLFFYHSEFSQLSCSQMMFFFLSWFNFHGIFLSHIFQNMYANLSRSFSVHSILNTFNNCAKILQENHAK